MPFMRAWDTMDSVPFSPVLHTLRRRTTEVVLSCFVNSSYFSSVLLACHWADAHKYYSRDALHQNVKTVYCFDGIINSRRRLGHCNHGNLLIITAKMRAIGFRRGLEFKLDIYNTGNEMAIMPWHCVRSLDTSRSQMNNMQISTSLFRELELDKRSLIATRFHLRTRMQLK